MTSIVFAGFGSNATETDILAGEYHVRAIQAPSTELVTSVTGIRVFSRIIPSITQMTNPVTAMRVIVIRGTPRNPELLTQSWSDAFASNPTSDLTVLFQTLAVFGTVTEFRFDKRALNARGGSVLYVACGDAKSDIGAGVEMNIDLAVTGTFFPERDDDSRLTLR